MHPKSIVALTIIVLLITSTPIIIDSEKISIHSLFEYDRNQLDLFNKDQKILKENVPNLLSNTPRVFTANHGQLGNEEVRFYDQGGAVWFTDDGVWYEVQDELLLNSRQSGINN